MFVQWLCRLSKGKLAWLPPQVLELEGVPIDLDPEEINCIAHNVPLIGPQAPGLPLLLPSVPLHQPNQTQFSTIF